MDATSHLPKAARLLVGALALLAVCLVAGGWSLREVRTTYRWVEHTHEVLYELEATLVHAVSIQSGVRGFSLTGDERYLSPYESGVVGVQQSIARLRSLLADNPRQQNRLTPLASLVDEEIAVMQQRLAARRTGGLVAASTLTADGRGKRVVDAIRARLEAMRQEERELLAERSRAARTATVRALLAIGIASVTAGGLVFAAIRVLRRVTEFSRLSPAG